MHVPHNFLGNTIRAFLVSAATLSSMREIVYMECMQRRLSWYTQYTVQPHLSWLFFFFECAILAVKRCAQKTSRKCSYNDILYFMQSNHAKQFCASWPVHDDHAPNPPTNICSCKFEWIVENSPHTIKIIFCVCVRAIYYAAGRFSMRSHNNNNNLTMIMHSYNNDHKTS